MNSMLTSESQVYAAASENALSSSDVDAVSRCTNLAPYISPVLLRQRCDGRRAIASARRKKLSRLANCKGLTRRIQPLHSCDCPGCGRRRVNRSSPHRPASRHAGRKPYAAIVVQAVLAASAVREADRARVASGNVMPLFWQPAVALTLDRIVGLSLLIDRHVRAMRDGKAFTPRHQNQRHAILARRSHYPIWPSIAAHRSAHDCDEPSAG